MSTLQELREDVNKAWSGLQEGWEHLWKRASQALTRFSPSAGEDSSRQIELASPRWGLLAAEVRESDDEVEVRLEAPGMDEADFEIDAMDDVLVVRGEKHVQRENIRGHYHIMECAYGRFERAIPLGVRVTSGEARASYRNGILSVRLPKERTRQRRRIEVKSA